MRSFSPFFANKLPIRSKNCVTTALAAIPGCLIVVGRSFSFMGLSRWHYRLAARLQSLVQSLEFEGRQIEEVSSEFSKIMLQFEEESPFTKLAETTDGSSKSAA